MKPFHPPRGATKRAFSGYTELQDAKWRILSDIAYAGAYGYAQTRMATPGVYLPEEVMRERVHHVAEGWGYEADLRDKATRGMEPLGDLPAAAQYHLAERLAPYPQTDRPWDRGQLHAHTEPEAPGAR
jgi:hypothetical protein